MWTANRLIPGIIIGGAALGLVAATAVNTRPKAAPEPPWRSAARTDAMQAPTYAIVDHGPIDLSPQLPWLGAGPNGSVARFPEDLYRGRAIAIRAGTDDLIPPEPRYSEPKSASYTIRDDAAERVAQAARVADETDAKIRALSDQGSDEAQNSPQPIEHQNAVSDDQLGG